ncbi:lysylphosphatidylglycerol synthase transmembrane domain-containing protein [Oceanobacter mangrovi]|uniref:lysylphosphatidylglycerol synthase transmembrane domain-containing protein n=1 Tax=Oceanobacter mangrovi TaxID=2862510 RepID=UPI001C8ECE4A|nr:lysylphosphatidylglycerol synthase transmembrane domain-containing protein [Oceanobacter mangrovi]
MLKSWKFWASIFILIAFIVLVEKAYGWTAVLQSWQSIPLPSLLIAIGLMLASYFLRAARFYDFFHQYCRGHWWQLTRITVVHNFLNNLLPMRTGEASFPLLMKTHFQCPVRHSAPALLWLRLLDLYALLVLSLWTLGGLLEQLSGISAELMWWLEGGLLLLPMIVLPLQNAIRQWLLQHPSSKANQLAELLQALPTSPWPFARALGWTLINWALKVAVYSWLLVQFSQIPLNQAWVGASTGELSSVLPIHGVAGAGTYEAGVVAGLAAWGIRPELALAGAVNLHLFVLGCTLLLTTLLALLIRPAATQPPAAAV